MFPSKISVAVFITSFMPDTTNPPSYVFEKVHQKLTSSFDLITKSFGYYTDYPIKILTCECNGTVSR